MTEFELPIRQDLIGHTPYGAPQQSVRARLNVNENPFPPSVALREALAQAVSSASENLNRYPDREAEQLRSSLSAYIERESGVRIGVDRIWAANGSNEIMSQIFSAFGGPDRSALTFPPTYSMYPEYSRNSFTQLLTVDRDINFEIDVEEASQAINELHPTLVLIASPNNPTGNAISLHDLETIIHCACRTGGLVIVDEAYAEFRRDIDSTAVRLLDKYPNVIVTRTLSKAFGFAGGRVGYCLTSTPAIVHSLMLVRLPYHLSALTQAAAITALAHDFELKEQVSILRAQRNLIVSELQAMGLDVAPSDANFVFFGTFPNRHAIWQGLCDHGVLIRETGPDHWLRVSVGTPEENQFFLDSLREVIRSSR
jgi:histidinol-phosphate aminotransferase